MASILTIGALGAGAMMLVPKDALPGSGSAPATIELAHFPAPSKDLLRRLDAEVTVPSGPRSLPPPKPVNVAAPDLLPASPAVPDPLPNELDARVLTAVNMRSGPSSSSSVVDVLATDTAVATIGSSQGWSHVALEDGREGWVYSTYLGGADDSAATAAPAAPSVAAEPARSTRTATVSTSIEGPLTNRSASIGSTVTTYQRPSASSPSLFLLHPGERVRIVEDRGDWIRVVSPSGISGWIRRAA